LALFETYAASNDPPPRPRFGKTLSFITLYARGLGVHFSGFNALLSISSAIVLLGDLFMFGLSCFGLICSFHGLSWTSVYVPAPGNCFLYFASASMLPSYLFLPMKPAMVTFLRMPCDGKLYPSMPNSCAPVLDNWFTISLGDIIAVID